MPQEQHRKGFFSYFPVPLFWIHKLSYNLHPLFYLYPPPYRLLRNSTKPSTEIHPAPFAGTAAENVLDWLESFNRIATHNVWNDQKQLQVIPVYLKGHNFELLRLPAGSN